MSSTRQEQQTELPPNEDSVDNDAYLVGLSSREPSDSPDGSPKTTDIDPEYLRVLKRRSLPYQPHRSSSLTSPPETPPDDSPLSKPIRTTPAREMVSDQVLPYHRRDWGVWWRGLLTGRGHSIAPTPNNILSPDDGNDDVSLGDQDKAIVLDDGISSDTSKSLDGTIIPERRVPSRRYFNPLSILWILRRCPTWRPALHPLIYGLRFFNRGRSEHDTPLDVGCDFLGGPSIFGIRLGEPLPAQEEVSEDINIDEKSNGDTLNISFDGSDDRQHPAHIGNSGPSTDLGEWQGIPVIDGIDPTTLNYSTKLEPVGNPPPTPRPRHRILSFLSNTLLSNQRVGETISRSRTQEFTDAALLLNISNERRFSTSSRSDTYDHGAKESTTSTNATIDVVGMVREGNLTIPDAMDSAVQESALTAVQQRADNWAQEQGGPSDLAITSVQATGESTSTSETAEASRSAAVSEEAEYENNGEDFAPLKRVPTHRPRQPRP